MSEARFSSAPQPCAGLTASAELLQVHVPACGRIRLGVIAQDPDQKCMVLLRLEIKTARPKNNDAADRVDIFGGIKPLTD